MARGWIGRYLPKDLKERLRQSIGRYLPSDLKKRLLIEPDIFALAKGTKPCAVEGARVSKIDHYMILLSANHQRVSASISHISVMIAVLVFSYNFVFDDHLHTSPNRWQLAIGAEVVLYLALAVALIRCLRDVGLDKLYSADKKGVENYESDFLNELVFRYMILGVSNVFIRLITAALLIILVWHYIVS